MQILSHRGFWLTSDEKNTELAFKRSFELGFGTETDVRDLDGKLVISHDPATRSSMPLEIFLDIYGQSNLPLAINIKADGLAQKLKASMNERRLTNWFVFDMSIPDTRHQLAAANPVFMRMSEFERDVPWLERAQGIWLDSFEDEWYLDGTLSGLLTSGKQICVVSSELHGRDNSRLWSNLLSLKNHKNLMLCTDLPIDAKQYFGEVDD
jgi:glycerophosphoryl diester phosphodiesterase